MSTKRRMTLDGRAVEFDDGETILDVAKRAGVDIPTLCHDSRLDPTGACRMCMVEVEGDRRLRPACATPATEGMSVGATTETIDRHRRALLALYMTDHVSEQDSCEDGKSCELHDMAQRFGAPSWPSLAPVRPDRPDDANPYIQFRADRCILCARCVRYCDDVESVSAITVHGRGPQTTIATADFRGLLDTTCELCGGCVDTCPTGALTEKQPLLAAAKRERDLRAVRTTCNYCGVGCQMDLMVDDDANDGRGQVVKVVPPPPGTLPNDGNLCVKGRFSYEFVHSEDRLKVPLLRGDDGELHEASWDDAIAAVANGLRSVAERHGNDALGFVSSSRCTIEENYLMQKLSRAVFTTNNIHQCSAT